MNYKEVFAIASDIDSESNEYELNNYNSFDTKLEKEFYYEYFRRELLFEVDILVLEEFLDFQLSNCEKPEYLIKILKRMLIPDAKSIVSNAELDMLSGSFHFDVDLGNDFIEIEGVIFNTSFKMATLYNYTALDKLQDNILERIDLIDDYIKKISKEVNNGISKLKWIGKPSHLAFIVNQLIDYGYIQSPEKMNGDLNVSELARQISNSFSIDNGSKSTLIDYSKEKSLNYINLKESFVKNRFYLPHSSEF